MFSKLSGSMSSPIAQERLAAVLVLSTDGELVLNGSSFLCFLAGEDEKLKFVLDMSFN